MESAFFRGFGISLFVVAGALIANGCNKSNNIDNKQCPDIPKDTCPEGFSREVMVQDSVEECEQDGEGECKKVGSCTVRCVDPRGCTSEGSVCGGSKPACCGEAAGTHSCIRFGGEGKPLVCSKRCDSNADCPNSCCDATINNGAFAACAPYDVCVSTGGATPACMSCLEEQCPDQLAECQADPTCAQCMAGEIYPLSPDCRNNATLKRGYGCALQKCPEECQT